MSLSESYRERDRQYLWHPYTQQSSLRDEFPVMARGEGVYLFDVDGRRYLDAISSWWCCNLGHGHPRLTAALCRQASELQHSILGNMSHPRAIELAERLSGMFGPEPRRIFFCGDGASAVEAALKMALQYHFNRGDHRRCQLASLQHAYHGDTLGAVSVGYLQHFHAPYRSLLFPVHQAPAPYCAECPCGCTPNTCAVECVEPMERLVAEHAETLAAVIVEPMCQGAAGMRMYDARYLQRLAAVCQRQGVLLIVDEIAMGFGRTGTMFAYQHAGIDPDIVCIGKGLSGGYLPISATVAKPSVFEAFNDTPTDGTFYHGHTFAGNPLSAAVALETLRVYEETDVLGGVQRTAGVLNHLVQKFRELEGVINVRTLGMIAAFDLDIDDPAELATRMQRLRRAFLQKGLLVRPLGPVLYVMPPLVISAEVLDDMMATIFAVVRDESMVDFQKGVG